MTAPIVYSGGPLSGQSYPLDKDQPIPTEIRHSGWLHRYVLRDGKFIWTGR